MGTHARCKFFMVCILLFAFFSLCPIVSADAFATVSPNISQGATVFIGEQGLNLQPAIDAFSVKAGYTPTSIGWWATASNPNTKVPDRTYTLTTPSNTLIAPATFVGYDGAWYPVDPSSGYANTSLGMFFSVADPALDLGIWDFTTGSDKSGLTVNRGDYLGFSVMTNMASALNATYRSPVYNSTHDGYIDIKVTNGTGTIYTALCNSSGQENSLLGENVSMSSWTWGDATGAPFNWSTAAVNSDGQFFYLPGTYSVVAESLLNNMKTNYLSGGAAYAGKTVSSPRTVTLLPGPPIASFTANVTSGTAPLSVLFTDSSLNTPTGWAWFFGDENYTAPWTQQTASAGWAARTGHSSVVMPDGSIILMGGVFSGGRTNEVWKSTNNGITWMNITNNSGWAARQAHTSVVMPDGSIVLMGGFTNTNMNDVWRSADGGVTWILVNTSAGWLPRSGHTSVVMPDGSIILMGGQAVSKMNDVWRSTDNGATWTQVNASAGGSPRSVHTSVVMTDGSIILMGGSGDKNDVWRSTDNGSAWTQINPNAGWSPRSEPASITMPDGSIVLMGGKNGTISYLNDVWRSADNGAAWTRINASAGWTGRSRYCSVAIPDGSIVVMGGGTDLVIKNDVWRFQPAGSSIQNPSHTFTTVGNYTVALQAYNAGGYNSTRKTGYINVTSSPILHGSVHNLNTSANYTTIQSAVNTATNGDTLLVDSGIFTEAVNISKSITLRGNDTGSGYPVIDAMNTNIPIWIGAHGITLDKFTVTNSTWSSLKSGGGGIVIAAGNAIVSNITTRNNSAPGIYIKGDSSRVNNSIIANILASNNTWCGIYGFKANFTTITNSTSAGNRGSGITIDLGTSNRIFNTTLASNLNYGISLVNATGSTITENTVRMNTVAGIRMDNSTGNTICNNNFNNSINVALSPGVNTWNLTKTAGTTINGGSWIAGNYWSDYTGVDIDGDGIGNTLVPYTAGGNITSGGDFLPLTNRTGSLPPVASFTANITFGNVPLAVRFNDTSTGVPIAWNWSFGDSSFSVLQNPLHTYTAPGTYTVTLNATNDGGSNVSTRSNLVTVSSGNVAMYLADPHHTGVYANGGLDPRNHEKWKYSSGSRVMSAPVIANGIIYYGDNAGRINAINRDTGTLHWSYLTGGSVASTPSVSDGMVYFGSNDRNVYALDANTGTRAWNYTTGDSIVSSPAVVNGVVYIGSDDGKVYAFNAGNGSVLWSTPTSGYWSAGGKFVNMVSTSPAVADGIVYAGNEGGYLYALNASTGATKWVVGRMSGTLPIVYTPSVYNGTVFFGTYDDYLRVYALNASTGSEIWNVTKSSPVQSAPVIAYGNVYIHTWNQKVYSLFASNGTQRWTATVGSYGFSGRSTPVLSNGSLYIGTNGVFKVLDAATGTLKWQRTISSNLYDPAAISDGVLYFGGGEYDNYLHALGGPTAVFGADRVWGEAPLTIRFTDTTSGSPTSWNWTFGDGDTTNATLQHPVHSFVVPGTYTVSLTASNLAGSNTTTKHALITVYPLTPDFIADTRAGYPPLTIHFTDQSTGTPIAWNWSFGDGNYSSVQNPVYTYSFTGSFNVTLNATNALGTNSTHKQGYIQVYDWARPMIAFTGTPLEEYAPAVIRFNDTSLAPVTSWLWNFGDGGTSTIKNATYTYQYAGDYPVRLTGTTASGTNFTQKDAYIRIYPTTADDAIDLPGHPTGSYGYGWNVNPDTGYYRNGYASVSGMPDNDFASLSVDIDIPNGPDAQLDFSWGVSSEESHDILSFLMDGGTVESISGENGGTPSYPLSSGPHTLEWQYSKDDNGSSAGSDSAWVDQVVITLCPVANFTANRTTGNLPLTVQFNDTSTNSVPDTWNWNFGDGDVSSEQNPVHSYGSAGIYSVRLDVSNGTLSSFKTRTNYIHAGEGIPVANLTANVTYGTAPLTVLFNDTSTNIPTSWNWSFGDGQFSPLQNPSHTYTMPGIYTIALKSENLYGNSTLQRTGYITARLLGDVNNNGAVDIGDVAGVAYMGVGLTSPDLSVADFNHNGEIDIGDAVKISYYFVGRIGAL